MAKAKMPITVTTIFVNKNYGWHVMWMAVICLNQMNDYCRDDDRHNFKQWCVRSLSEMAATLYHFICSACLNSALLRMTDPINFIVHFDTSSKQWIQGHFDARKLQYNWNKIKLKL